MDDKKSPGRAAAKKTRVQKRNLSEFTIKLRGAGKVFAGGEICCAWNGTAKKFCDVNELMRFIEEQCDAVWYPQPQRKLRGWDIQQGRGKI
ncbi:MAG: hypothetical protein FWD23_07910 [Oscillospiraceae bacterium]|nr:hypothetical protein [Oscillospiraceae bacterium]